MRQFEEHARAGTFFRNMRRLSDIEGKLRSLKQISTIFREMEPSVLRDDMLAALSGDPAAERRVQAVGPWQMFLAGSGRSSWVHLAEEYARVERLCLASDTALGLCDYRRVARAVAKQREVRIFWRHGSLERLALAQTPEQTLVPRLVAYLELQMSCLAMLSTAGGQLGHSEDSNGEFSRLFETTRWPGSNYMRCLLVVSGARTQTELLDLAAEHLGAGEELPSVATVKRWFGGSHFPPAKNIKALALAISRSKSAPSVEVNLERLFWGARRANASMRLAGILHDRLGARTVLGAEDVHEWAASSYAHWMTHWRSQSASVSTPTS